MIARAVRGYAAAPGGGDCVLEPQPEGREIDRRPAAGELILVGWISNPAEIAATLEIPIAADDLMVDEAFRRLGAKAFSICHGSYVAVVLSEDRLTLAASAAPGPPLYWAWDPSRRGLWFGTACALFPEELHQLRESEEVTETHMQRHPNATPFRAIDRVPSGTVVEYELRQSEISRERYFEWARFAEEAPEISEATAMREIRDSITAAVGASLRGRTSCLVSGGIDSSVIAIIALRDANPIEFVSVGTEQANEFANARVLGAHLGRSVREVTITEEAYERCYPEVVLALEHPFSTYAEYVLPLWTAMREDGLAGDVLTGYGSDILFGGFASPEDSAQKVGDLIRSEYESSLYSNEFSPSLSPDPGQRVASPFFDSMVVSTASSIDPSMKHADGIEKSILRRAFEADLNPEIAWRPKLGVHESTRSASWLTDYLGPASDLPTVRTYKDKVSFEILRARFEQGRSVEEISMEEVVWACR
jgi:(carboxyethyl)arginine beta-lactam-synthase